MPQRREGGLSLVMCDSWRVRLSQGSQKLRSSCCRAAVFSVLVSLAGPAPPKMGPSGLLLILVPFILLESVQKPGLVKGFILNVCSLPKVVGPCLAYFRRWWYNKETKTCSRFIYGGCQGNNNNFQSESVCKIICSKK